MSRITRIAAPLIAVALMTGAHHSLRWPRIPGQQGDQTQNAATETRKGLKHAACGNRAGTDRLPRRNPRREARQTRASHHRRQGLTPVCPPAGQRLRRRQHLSPVLPGRLRCSRQARDRSGPGAPRQLTDLAMLSPARAPRGPFSLPKIAATRTRRFSYCGYSGFLETAAEGFGDAV